MTASSLSWVPVGDRYPDLKDKSDDFSPSTARPRLAS